MNIQLNIENDAELRNYVKDLIHGQVKSIIREEIKDILKDILSKKIKETDIPNVDFLVKEEIKNSITKEIFNPAWNEPNYIKKQARIVIEEYVKKSFETYGFVK